MKMLQMSINLDQLIKELESMVIADLSDNELCNLGLKLRMASTVMSQQQNLTAVQQQSVETICRFDSLVAREMEYRGYRVVDSAELTDISLEEVVEALSEMDFITLLDWVDVLQKTAAENEQDAELLDYVYNEIAYRSLKNSGGLLN